MKAKVLTGIFLIFTVAGVTTTAAAEGSESVTVHFNGTVTQPTCGFTLPEQTVSLDAIKSSDLEKTAVGQATDIDSKGFQLDMNCSSRAEAEHISIALSAESDVTNSNAIKNTASDNGVGLELFTESGTALALNQELPQNTYLDRLNEGNDNLNYTVKYARLGNQISGGQVAGNAVFVVSYK